MRNLLLSISLIALLASCGAKTEQRELVWQDEFNYNGAPDSTKWNYQVGNGCPDMCGWGNNEQEFYTKRKENVRVENGKLIIEVRKEAGYPSPYTSAKINSKHKGDWQYGYVEVSAKLPQGKGTWPAIWMLPTLDSKMDWPLDGEVDIMEHVGYNQGKIFGTIHTEKYNHIKGTQKSDSIYIRDVHEKFHTYALEWTPQYMKWFVDGKQYHEVHKNHQKKPGWPFDQPFHLILNVAVGGNWGGKYGVDDSIWPQKMEIDYVRVYKLNSEETINE